MNKKDKNPPINILELEKVWLVCKWFAESLRGKTVSFHVENTTAVASLLKKGGTY